MLLKRTAARLVRERLQSYPAVGLTGPRQCGKTTLAKRLGGSYFDLEQEPERLRLDLEWDRLSRSDDLVILDEAQSWPEVFPRMRGAIDADRKRTGRFLLLGSVSPALMTHVSESLSGRLSLIELTPLLLSELPEDARDRRWLCGGYPDGGVLTPKAYPQWQLDYLALLTQRDLPTWGLQAAPQTTERLVRMLSVLHGQPWNASQVGQSLGLSYHTVNSYVDYLVGAFLIRRLPAYQANIRKRLVKAPRVYWRDSGLLHAIQNIPDLRALIGQPWVGASWEGHVVEQTLGELSSLGRHVTGYHFRTSDRHEIDLVLDFGTELWAVEIKLTTSPSPADMNRLDKSAELIGASRRFLISQTETAAGDEIRMSCNLTVFLDLLRGDRPFPA